MPDEAGFAELYKKLLDRNFDPSPARSRAALEAVLRRLYAEAPHNCENSTGSSVRSVIQSS